jgi:hypothetical protein
MISREQAMTALLALLASAGEFSTIGRRNRSPETIAAQNTPALILVKHSETYERKSPSVPAIRTLEARAIVYCDAGQDENAIPEATINTLLDGIDAVMRPDNAALGRNTLGGLVYSAMIDGEVICAPGDVTGKSLAIVPIKIVIP